MPTGDRPDTDPPDTDPPETDPFDTGPPDTDPLDPDPLTTDPAATGHPSIDRSTAEPVRAAPTGPTGPAGSAGSTGFTGFTVPATSRLPAALVAAGPWASVLLVLSAARSVLGAAAFVAPVTGSVLLGVDRGSAHRMTWATRAFASRDFAVGLLGVAGTRQGATAARTAAAIGAVCDAGDALTFLLAVRSRQIGPGRGALLVLSSAGAATLGLVASQQTQR